jgi:hypothetical protein
MSGLRGKTLNYWAVAVFSPVLILTGLAGFVLPATMSPTSGAPPYNVFHIVFGCLGVAAVLSAREALMQAFNVGFGLIDLYQVAASVLHLPPEQYFRWTRADDILHVLIGLALVGIGSYGILNRHPPR